ncbi:LpxI family protein [Desulfoplanes sp.]
MTRPSPRLGLIAGGGTFPAIVATNAHKQGYTVIGVGFTNDTSQETASATHRFAWLRLGRLGALIKFFRREKVSQVVFAGPINKPRALDIRPDFRAARVLFSLVRKSDDSLLRAIAKEFEKEGMEVVSATRFVPELATPRGVLTRRPPSRQETRDILYGLPVARTLGHLDIGQCIVVREQMTIAVEGIEGTNATILRAGTLAGKGGVVIKVFKPGQDARIDLPAIGPETIQAMVTAQATCLSVDAKNSLLFSPQETLALADRHGITILGMDDSLLEEIS